MTLLRKAATQALEALVAAYQGKDKQGQVIDAITALKAALAEPVQEPVAWRWPANDIPGSEWRYSLTKTRESAEPLYAAPVQRKPLTDEEIDNLPWNGSPRQFARAIERAHGIGVQE